MIVIVAIGQLYLLRTLLANKSQGYEGVWWYNRKYQNKSLIFLMEIPD